MQKNKMVLIAAVVVALAAFSTLGSFAAPAFADYGNNDNSGDNSGNNDNSGDNNQHDFQGEESGNN
jgi:hypothetical protein